MQSFFDEIKHFNKIVIGGNSASGKSTLAKILIGRSSQHYQ